MTDIPETDPADVTMKEQLKACGREIGLRRSVYPRFVADGSMSIEKAQHELAAMRAIYGSLKRLEEQQDAAKSQTDSSTEV